MNNPGALFGLLLFLQIMLVLGVMLGGIYLLSCLRRIAVALEVLADTNQKEVSLSSSPSPLQPEAPIAPIAPTPNHPPHTSSDESNV